MTDKQQLRKSILAKRQGLPAETQGLYSSIIVETIRQSEVFASSRNILAYLPFRGEVDLSPLFDWLESQGKQLALPKVVNKAVGHMDAYFLGKPWRDNRSEERRVG